jgi:CRISPR-associated protein Cmr3
MTERVLLIEPHDPVIFRDGRPFTDGLPARTLPFPIPATTAGAIRTRSGENLDFEDNDVIESLLKIRQVGPFAATWNPEGGKWELVLPAPADAVGFETDGGRVEFAPLRPSDQPPDGGCDLPDGLRPLFGAPLKKAMQDAPRFWRAGFMMRWLTDPAVEREPADPGVIGFGNLPVQRRVHVAIDPLSLTASQGMLFTTDGLEFAWPSLNPDEDRLGIRRAGIVSKVVCPPDAQWPAVAPIGGERRLALWREMAAGDIEWPTPPEIHGDLVRLMLVTPCPFDDGWRPAWLRHGRPPETEGLKLELVAAAVPRFQPVSGWDLRKGHRGPKATRFLAPAGSVYFFRREKGDLSQLWMRSICDRPEDRRDGYGIVLTGGFTWHKD